MRYTILFLTFISGVLFTDKLVHAYECSSDIASYIKPQSTVFIGKMLSEEIISDPVDASLISFEVYYHWQGVYSTFPNQGSIVKIVITKVPTPFSDSEETYPAFKAEQGEFYLVVADAAKIISTYPTIDTYCNGSSLLSHLYLTQDLKHIIEHLGAPVLRFNEPTSPCESETEQQSFNRAEEVFEGTLVDYDIYEQTQAYDIIHHRFKVHKSWKSSSSAASGVRDIYTYRSQEYCGMLRDKQGCGKTFQKNTRHIIYAEVISDKAAFVTSCSRVIEGKQFIINELDIRESPDYEIIYYQ